MAPAAWGWLLVVAVTCSDANFIDCHVSNTSHLLRPLQGSCYHAVKYEFMSVGQLHTTLPSEQTTELYYKMPPLFHLDHYERCLSQPQGAYCMGIFDLLPKENKGLFKVIQQFSKDPDYFDHTRLHRGLCISARCQFSDNSLSLKNKFSQCVESHIHEAFGLEAKLAKLFFCETREKRYQRPVDNTELAFALGVALIFLLNAIGTVYDAIGTKNYKQSHWISAWSVTTNLKQLMADHEPGKPQLLELQPLYAFKTIATLIVIMLHVQLMQYVVYSSNPLSLEQIRTKSVLAFGFYNGLMVVQTYVVVTSFLLAHKLLLDAKSCKNITVASLPKRILQRIIRITPAYALTVGMAATWWSRTGSSLQWMPLVAGQENVCRTTWWMNLLYFNNLVYPHKSCITYTWYLAADMQLYVVGVSLTLLLLRSRRPVQILSLLLTLSVATNYLIAYKWDLRASVHMTRPEAIRQLFANHPSFPWMYTAPWGNLPSALLGLILAHVHSQLQTNQFKIDEHKWFMLAYKSSPALMAGWVLAGRWAPGAAQPAALALYTALERPVFAALVAVAILGALHKIDNGFLWWRGWEAVGKMQLCIFLVHWVVVINVATTRNALSEIGVFEAIANWLVTSVLTLVFAVPMYLMVEVPVHKLLKKLLL